MAAPGSALSPDPSSLSLPAPLQKTDTAPGPGSHPAPGSDNSSVLATPGQFLLLQFSAGLLVSTAGREFSVTEDHSVDLELSRLVVREAGRNSSSSCSFHTGGWGHATAGVRCRTSRNFPEECFCWDKLCSYPYFPLHKVNNNNYW